MRRSLLLLLVAAAGCNGLDRIFGHEDQLTVLLRNRDRWNALGIRDYRFHYQLGGCECIPELTQPMVIVVEDGQVVSVSDPIYDMYAAVGGWPSIDSLFARTERDMRRGYKVDITYDGQFHFPGKISADYPATVDDEYTITANRLVRAPN